MTAEVSHVGVLGVRRLQKRGAGAEVMAWPPRG